MSSTSSSSRRAASAARSTARLLHGAPGDETRKALWIFGRKRPQIGGMIGKPEEKIVSSPCRKKRGEGLGLRRDSQRLEFPARRGWLGEPRSYD